MIDADKVPNVIRILNETCDARIDDRDAYGFTRYVTTTRDFEWRFCGALGFGGKFRQNCNREGTPYVDCYPEHETPGRRRMMNEANERLAALFEAQTKIAPPPIPSGTGSAGAAQLERGGGAALAGTDVEMRN